MIKVYNVCTGFAQQHPNALLYQLKKRLLSFDAVHISPRQERTEHILHGKHVISLEQLAKLRCVVNSWSCDWMFLLVSSWAGGGEIAHLKDLT